MRERPGVRRHGAAPRYQEIASEHAGQLADDRRAEAARAEAARFFYDLRRSLRLARVAIANRIGTDVAVVEALETGALSRLPPWPQIVRIVTTYTHLVGMDPRPVLHALHFALAHQRQQAAREGWAKRLVRSIAAAPHALSSALRQRSLALTWGAGIAVPAVLLGSLVLTSGLQASQFPGPLASMLGFEPSAARAETIKRLEGLVWIDVADPRQRRSDKLPGSAR